MSPIKILDKILKGKVYHQFSTILLWVSSEPIKNNAVKAATKIEIHIVKKLFNFLIITVYFEHIGVSEQSGFYVKKKINYL